MSTNSFENEIKLPTSFLNSDRIDLTSAEIEEFFIFRCRGYRQRRNDSKLCIRQNPRELSDFIYFLKRYSVTSYAELGVEAGGTFFLISHILKDSYLLGVDLDLSKLAEGQVGANHYRNQVSLIEADLSEWVPPRRFDLVFIDSNQPYCEMLELSNRVRPHCRFLAFHDIFDRRYGAKRIWGNEAKHWGQVSEIRDDRPKTISPGIGIAAGQLLGNTQ